MPRKIYDDEKLRPEALKLRRQGLSYREIARRLGCSVYKVHELISDYESPSSRLKQAMELADRLDALASKLSELEAQASKLQSSLSSLKALEDLAGEASKLRKEVKGLNRRLGELEESVEGIANSVADLEESVAWIRRSAERRLREDHNGCRWLNKDGYCTLWYWHRDERVRGWDMRQDVVGGKEVYLLNAKKHPLICAACPSYEPRG